MELGTRGIAEACRYLAATARHRVRHRNPAFVPGGRRQSGSHCCNSPRRNRLLPVPAQQDSARQSHRANCSKTSEILKIGADVTGDLRALRNIRHFQRSGLRRSAGARRRVGHRREEPAQTFGHRARPAGLQSPAPEQLGSRDNSPTNSSSTPQPTPGSAPVSTTSCCTHPNQTENDEMIPQIYLRTRQGRVAAAPPSRGFSRARSNHVECHDGNEIAEGALVDVYTRPGDFIARGHYQIGSIAVRVLTFEQEPIDHGVVAARCIAVALRRAPHARAHGCPRRRPATVWFTARGTPCRDSSSTSTTRPPSIQCHSVGMYHARLTDRRCAPHGLRRPAYRHLRQIVRRRVPFKAGLESPWTATCGATRGALPRTSCSENGEQFLRQLGERGRKRASSSTSATTANWYERYARGPHGAQHLLLHGRILGLRSLRAGHEKVCSVDSSERAVALADENMRLNFGEEAPHTVARRRRRGIPQGHRRPVRPDHPRPAGLRQAPQGAGQCHAGLQAAQRPGAVADHEPERHPLHFLLFAGGHARSCSARRSSRPRPSPDARCASCTS